MSKMTRCVFAANVFLTMANLVCAALPPYNLTNLYSLIVAMYCGSMAAWLWFTGRKE